MAAVLQDLLGDDFKVDSAGVREGAAGVGANPLSIECMADRGIDLSGHMSRWVGHLNLDSYSHIVCVGDSEADAVRSHLTNDGVVVVVPNDGFGIDDPFGKGIEGYRNCLANIDAAMRSVANMIHDGSAKAG